MGVTVTASAADNAVSGDGNASLPVNKVRKQR
jgi:hypothetical protein